jgi:hypothetical protein
MAIEEYDVTGFEVVPRPPGAPAQIILKVTAIAPQTTPVKEIIAENYVPTGSDSRTGKEKPIGDCARVYLNSNHFGDLLNDVTAGGCKVSYSSTPYPSNSPTIEKITNFDSYV